jgi:hypothetical protein
LEFISKSYERNKKTKIEKERRKKICPTGPSLAQPGSPAAYAHQRPQRPAIGAARPSSGAAAAHTRQSPFPFLFFFCARVPPVIPILCLFAWEISSRMGTKRDRKIGGFIPILLPPCPQKTSYKYRIPLPSFPPPETLNSTASLR